MYVSNITVKKIILDSNKDLRSFEWSIVRNPSLTKEFLQYYLGISWKFQSNWPHEDVGWVFLWFFCCFLWFFCLFFVVFFVSSISQLIIHRLYLYWEMEMSPVWNINITQDDSIEILLLNRVYAIVWSLFYISNIPGIPDSFPQKLFSQQFPSK